MVQTETDLAGKKFEISQLRSGAPPKAAVRSSFFKYYIHDSIESCRLQLLGQLSEADIPELSGCWRTAKTTLASRKLLLDLRNLSAFDDAGRQWIISMANEGALLLPESFLRTGMALGISSDETLKPGWGIRFISFLRGSRILPAQSSTQAP